VRELLMFIARYLGFLFEGAGYRFTDSQANTADGDAMVVLESPLLRIRLTRDRSQLLLSFQPINGKPAEWFSPGLIRGLLTGERPQSEVLDQEWAMYLASVWPTLEARFANQELAVEAAAELREQARIRANQLFG
jgi:hypothetical protein